MTTKEREGQTIEFENSGEPKAVTLKVTPGSTEGSTKLKAFGMFGLMTIGAPYQLYHLQVAEGSGLEGGL